VLVQRILPVAIHAPSAAVLPPNRNTSCKDGPPHRLTLRAASSKLLSIRFLYAKRDKEDG